MTRDSGPNEPTEPVEPAGDGDPPRPPAAGNGPRGTPAKGSRRPRGLLLVAGLMALVIALASLANSQFSGSAETSTYRARELLKDGRLDPRSFVFEKSGGVFKAKILAATPGEPSHVEVRFVTESEVDQFRAALDAYNQERNTQVDWTVKDRSFWESLLQPLMWVFLIVFLYWLFMRQMRGAGTAGGVFSFGKSRAKLAAPESTGVTFEDVAGVEEAEQEVQEVIEFLKRPGRFLRLGGRMPRGILLVGPPGTGKTLLARAIAGEANVPFFSISGSDFVEMFVGVGASRVRDLFRQARESSPCIIFLDEVDAVGRRRGAGLGGGHDEREQTLNAILVEMDGFQSDEGIIVLASTNRPDVLDPALLRPGRFDREIMIDLPDLKGREAILRVHTRKTKLDPSVDLSRVARATPGFSGAELAAIVNEAAILAGMNDQETILEGDLVEARDKMRWGREKRSRVVSDEDRAITAFHEAGHALVAHLLPEVEPLHKVTIIPRGMALGSTMQLPEKDRYHMKRGEVLGNLVLLYAGRVAEQRFCGDITSGARNDIERATDLARRMVCEWGMSEELGPINYSENEETLFLGRELTRSRNHSEHVASRIDEEVGTVVKEAYRQAEELVARHASAVERIARALLERETLGADEVAGLVEEGNDSRAPSGSK